MPEHNHPKPAKPAKTAKTAKTANSLLRLGVLASGKGSNLQAIMDAIINRRLEAEVAIVISDNPTAYALERARAVGIAALVCNPRTYADRVEYEQALVQALREQQVELVILAGYMRLVGNTLLENFPNRIMNIHPALLPAFPGLHGQEQAWEYGVKFSGCTVHFVDQGMDSGPIILQAVVPVRDDDTAEELAARILEQEHRIYPEAIQYYAQGSLELIGRKVKVRPKP
jgi:phosphoribosylglycinamide formyltransferase-1